MVVMVGRLEYVQVAAGWDGRWGLRGNDGDPTTTLVNLRIYMAGPD
jgi:hypothetical protein